MKPFFLLLLCLFMAPAGCARVYWDRDWVYEGIITVAETQNLTVTSDPPAFLWVDGEFTGETPVRVTLSYPQSEIRLAKQQYRESGEEREVLDREQNIRRFSQETGHLLRFRAAGHHDQTVRIKIPRAEPTVAVTLRPRAGLDAALDCRITVTAPPVFFPRIDEVIRENALAPAIRRTPESPTPLGPADLARQTLEFSVPASEALDRITDALYADARRRNVVFNVTRAETALELAANPEREFRAVWISFIDWPGGETDPEAQRRDLVEMLEAFHRLHFNAVFFHARVAGDTYYDSPLEPWSDLLTGKPGGDPGYDPLAFAVEEAHRRGMELHAWVNPFRVRRQATCGAAGTPETTNHVARRHPDWVLQFRLGNGRCYRMLDPGRPEVLEYTEKVVTDLVRRYDVDGVHFDDTFYPYPQSGFPGARDEDAASFRRHGGGRSRGDWRRGNVDRLVERINAAIKSIRPHVRFGISPFGIWRAGVPHGAKGMSAYDAIYTDALAWLEARTIDYLAPQLYWTIGEQPDYESLVDWWGEAVAESGRHLYPGQIIYYVRPGEGRDGGTKPESPREILRQVVLNRDLRNRNVLGNALYRARGESGEILGTEALREMLENRIYATPALPPAMPWLETTEPSAPKGLRLARATDGEATLRWDPVGEGVWQYAVYAIAAEDAVDMKAAAEAARLVAVTGETRMALPKVGPVRPGDLLLVRAVSRTNETGPASVALRWKANPETVEITPAEPPTPTKDKKPTTDSTPEPESPETSPPAEKRAPKPESETAPLD